MQQVVLLCVLGGGGSLEVDDEELAGFLPRKSCRYVQEGNCCGFLVWLPCARPGAEKE